MIRFHAVSVRWLDEARSDIRAGLRLLRQSPLVTITAAVSLAVGIGANAAIFTVANALLFRAPAGVAAPDRLVDIGMSRLDGGFNPGSYPTYLDIRQGAATLADVYAHPMFPQAMSLEVGATTPGAERVFGHLVTTNYFSVLGTIPFAGRLFESSGSNRALLQRSGPSDVVVLNYRFWTRRFNGDPAVIGRAIRLNGQPYTVQRTGATNPGFDASDVQLASLQLSIAGYTDVTGPQFARELADRIRRLPGAEGGTIAAVLPGGFEGIGLGGVTPQGAAMPAAQQVMYPSWNVVEPGYFATLRIPVLAGRDFNRADVAGSEPVAIVAEGIARRFWPNQAALGQYLSRQVFAPGGRPKGLRLLRVVGVVGDVKSTSLVDGRAESFVYLPLQQEYMSNLMVAARARDGRRLAEQVRATVAAMNPTLPIVQSQTLQDAVALGQTPQRVVASLSGSLGLVGLLLAAIGIYGVAAYAVTCRLREFGIRIALGARRSNIVAIVLRQGAWLAGAGSLIGLVLAAGTSQVLVVLLFGAESIEPAILLGTTVLFVAAGLVASYGPARRATNADPVAALRHE